MNMSVYEWKDLPWRKIEQQVFKLQQRIFKASKDSGGWIEPLTVVRGTSDKGY
jgi:hypothetical protein